MNDLKKSDLKMSSLNVTLLFVHFNHPEIKILLKLGCQQTTCITNKTRDAIKKIKNKKTSLTKPQKEKLARNKAGLRALTKKSVSLKKKKAILQKGGFLGSLDWDI
jgi:hypothetical protein